VAPGAHDGRRARRRALKPRARARESPDPLARLRAIVAALPETSERISHGAPTFWGGKKTFASFHVNHHGDGRVALWCKAAPGAQEALVDADPARFFVPPYVGPSGWLGVRLDRDVDWGFVAGLLEEGWRMVAPKRAVDRLEAGARPPRGRGQKA
jgi:hypothetical protein